jgi:hypothetical protein
MDAEATESFLFRQDVLIAYICRTMRGGVTRRDLLAMSLSDVDRLKKACQYVSDNFPEVQLS